MSVEDRQEMREILKQEMQRTKECLALRETVEVLQKTLEEEKCWSASRIADLERSNADLLANFQKLRDQIGGAVEGRFYTSGATLSDEIDHARRGKIQT